MPGPEWCDSCSMHLPDVRWHDLGHGVLLCSAFGFVGPIRKTIIDWKEQQHRAARRRVQRWFAAGLLPLTAQRPDVVCIPIPSSPRNDRHRGARVLHDAVAAIGVEVGTGLISARSRKDQTGLTRGERIENMHNAFTWISDDPRPVLLIDDVVTSGSTLRAAATAVRGNGGHVWASFGLARRGNLTSVVSRPEGLRLSCSDKEDSS